MKFSSVEPSIVALTSTRIQSLRSHFKPSVNSTLRHSKWLLPTNRYYSNATTQIKADYSSLPYDPLNNTDVASYILCSSPVHCLDGWSFLSRSIDALIHGDIASVVHFAYYAELRAALAILAADGIGILKSNHILAQFSGATNVTVWNGNTHEDAWLALEAWSKSSRSSDLFLRGIRLDNVPLEDWLTGFGIPQVAASRLTGQTLLQQWGFDLQLSSAIPPVRSIYDRDARNEVSYRPSRLTPWPQCKIDENYELIQSLWALLQPSFQFLDRELLVSTLIDSNLPDYNRHVENMVLYALDRVNLSLFKKSNRPIPSERAQRWKNFLTSPTRHKVISYARSDDSVRSNDYHLQILCRAALLLRIATANCQQLLRDWSISPTQLHFWWHSIIEDLGIVPSGKSPDTAEDLWFDIEMHSEDLNTWMQTQTAPLTTFAWRRENAEHLSVLGEFERAGLWGMGL